MRALRLRQSTRAASACSASACDKWATGMVARLRVSSAAAQAKRTFEARKSALRAPSVTAGTKRGAKMHEAAALRYEEGAGCAAQATPRACVDGSAVCGWGEAHGLLWFAPAMGALKKRCCCAVIFEGRARAPEACEDEVGLLSFRGKEGMRRRRLGAAGLGGRSLVTRSTLASGMHSTKRCAP